MDLPAASLCLARGRIEAPRPVEAEHSHNRQEHSHTSPGRPFDLEGVEGFPRLVTVATLNKNQAIYSGARLQQERITQLHGVFGVDSRVVASGLRSHRNKFTVLVTSQSDNILAIQRVPAHTVAPHSESFERRQFILIIVPQISHLGARHKHQLLIARQGMEEPPVQEEATDKVDPVDPDPKPAEEPAAENDAPVILEAR